MVFFVDHQRAAFVWSNATPRQPVPGGQFTTDQLTFKPERVCRCARQLREREIIQIRFQLKPFDRVGGSAFDLPRFSISLRDW